jgi:threonine dehydrogenase-like Zn-dependent dehydrogenase
MKALGLTEFGGPDVLKVVDLPEPEPGPGEVRIRIHAAAVNPADLSFRSGGWADRAGNGGETAPLALRLPTMQAIAQDSCGAIDVWRRVTVRRGGSPCPYGSCLHG